MISVLFALSFGMIAQSAEKHPLDVFPSEDDILVYRDGENWRIFWTESQLTDLQAAPSSGKSGGNDYCPSILLYVGILPNEPPVVFQSSWKYRLRASTDECCTFFPTDNSISATVGVFNSCEAIKVPSDVVLSLSTLRGWEEATEQAVKDAGRELPRPSTWKRCHIERSLAMPRVGEDSSVRQFNFREGLSITFRADQDGRVAVEIVVTTQENRTMKYFIAR